MGSDHPNILTAKTVAIPLAVSTDIIGEQQQESSTAFFSLVSARYERGSIILTSNKGFAEWGSFWVTP